MEGWVKVGRGSTPYAEEHLEWWGTIEESDDDSTRFVGDV